MNLPSNAVLTRAALVGMAKELALTKMLRSSSDPKKLVELLSEPSILPEVVSKNVLNPLTSTALLSEASTAYPAMGLLGAGLGAGAATAAHNIDRLMVRKSRLAKLLGV